VLAAIADSLAAQGQPVHRLRMPWGDDAPFAAMVGLAGQLYPRGAGSLESFRDPRRSFTAKLKVLESELESRQGTLLIDDSPSGRDDHATTVFDDRLAELSERMLQLRAVSVVAASSRRFAGPSVTIHARFDAASVLASFASSPFRQAANALGSDPRLNSYSPVEVRLVVAAVAANRSASQFAARRWDPSDLLDVVLEGETALRSLVGALARARTPFDEDLLRLLGADGLTPRARALLHEILLIRMPEGMVLHGLIARRARWGEWLPASEGVRAHQILTEWHRQRFQSDKATGALASAFGHEIEVVHHLTEAGDIDGVLAAPIYFSEQYDALGKALSREKRYEDAVVAYDRAITFDEPDRIDAYAHHYLAYNLDVLGREMDRVRKEYQVALDVQPTHPWYWNRIICFLIAVGYLDEAMDLWSGASSSFQLDRGQEWVATELHRNVAHLLAHRGQLVPARRVMDDVPHRARSADWYRSLDAWLSELEAADRDELVFPPHLEPALRWSGPHLLRNPADAVRVLEWTPGYITASHAGGVRARVAHERGGRVEYSYRDLTISDLEESSAYRKYGLELPAGTFIEILKVKDGSGRVVEQLLSWPRQERWLPGLPPIFPPPNRYIRRALTGR
jgi:tetratricopeptide (TPR) repeat protein